MVPHTGYGAHQLRVGRDQQPARAGARQGRQRGLARGQLGAAQQPRGHAGCGQGLCARAQRLRVGGAAQQQAAGCLKLQLARRGQRLGQRMKVSRRLQRGQAWPCSLLADMAGIWESNACQKAL